MECRSRSLTFHAWMTSYLVSISKSGFQSPPSDQRCCECMPTCTSVIKVGFEFVCVLSLRARIHTVFFRFIIHVFWKYSFLLLF